MLLIKDTIKISDKENYTELFVKLMCVLYNINLSRGGRMLVVYYMLYGISQETHAKFIKDKRASNMNSLYNLRGELKEFNVLIRGRYENEYSLSEHFNSVIENEVGFLIKLKNELREDS